MKNNIPTENLIEFLQQYENEKKEQGFIPTVEMLIYELKAEEVSNEAQEMAYRKD